LISSVLAQPDRPPDLRISLSSTIPIASGMGSGAAVATALARALAVYLGRELPPDAISALVYASEQRYHGTPSGIDNTVIAFEQPIWFIRARNGEWSIRDGGDHSQPRSPALHAPAIESISISAPFTLLIGDTGVRSATRLPVGEVRRRWQVDSAAYEALFDQVSDLVVQAREALKQGEFPRLGALLDRNHALLQEIGVSSPALDTLVGVARSAGALGAKLSGAGWGGVMLALVTPAGRDRVAAALTDAGAQRVIETIVQAHPADPLGERGGR
jgi:mevalonate kinase